MSPIEHINLHFCVKVGVTFWIPGNGGNRPEEPVNPVVTGDITHARSTDLQDLSEQQSL